ncbi:MAG: electron transfer flavoprotein subunit beta/FixA family protein [Treponema sp.]|nr:electron transfer flavoprotein subunit beta/FixA family protein [Treponema sp.]
MKIIVCIKQVPDTSEVTMDPETNTLIRTGIPVIINPDDKSGIEAALTLRGKIAGSTVTVVTMGPPQAEMALYEALSMGCDEAVLISGRQFSGSDTLATSSIIAAALKKIGYDLVITGRQAIDGDTAQVGPQIAEHLGIPQVSYAEEVMPEEGSLVVLRQFEDRYHRLRVKLPCLLTAIKELAEPRFMTVSGIVDADRKEIKVLNYESLADVLDPETIGLKGSPTNVVRSFTKEPKAQGALLKGLSPAEAVDAIMARLHESHLI